MMMTTPRDAIAGLSERLGKFGIKGELAADIIELVAASVEMGKAEAATAIDALQARVKELEEEASDWRGLYVDAFEDRENLKAHYIDWKSCSTWAGTGDGALHHDQGGRDCHCPPALGRS